MNIWYIWDICGYDGYWVNVGGYSSLLLRVLAAAKCSMSFKLRESNRRTTTGTIHRTFVCLFCFVCLIYRFTHSRFSLDFSS